MTSTNFETMIPDWAILDSSDTDFRFGDVITLIEKIKKVKQPNPNYVWSWNQWKFNWSRNWCTFVWPISSVISYRESKRDDIWMRDAWDFCVEEYGYKSSEWHFKTTGEEAVAKYWNEIEMKDNEDQQMLYFTVPRLSDEYWYGLSKWYHANVWYRGNAKRNKDRLDWILSETYHWDGTYGHIRRDRAVDKKYIQAVDNYIGRMIDWKEVNDYLIPRENLESLRRPSSTQTWYFPSATFYVPLKEISEIPLDWTKFWLAKITENSLKRDEVHSDTRLSEKTKMDYKKFFHESNEKIRNELLIN